MVKRIKTQEDVVHKYNGILLSHKKGINLGLSVEMWIDQGTVKQSEGSQKEKHKYCPNTHMWNLKKWYR